LFDEDRLVGGTPVPGVGWIFTPRRPVRGPLTPGSSGAGRRGGRNAAERAQKDVGDESSDSDLVASKASNAKKGEKVDRAKRAKKVAVSAGGEVSAESIGSASSTDVAPKSRRRGSGRSKGSDRSVEAAIAQATEEALGPGETEKKKGTKRRGDGGAAPEAVNDPLPFITFASEHPVGSQLEGTVVSFTSHGAMAQVEDMLCYVPLAGLGDPPPRRARDVVKLGESRVFELVALDPARRGAQLALPDIVATHGQVAEGAEEAASEVRSRRKRSPAAKGEKTSEVSAAKADPSKKDEAKEVAAGPNAEPSDKGVRTRKTASARAAAKALPSDKTATAKKVAPRKPSLVSDKSVSARKAAPKKATPATKAATKPTVAKKKAALTKKAANKKTAPAKTAAPAKTVSSRKKAAATKKAATTKKAPAPKTAKTAKTAKSAKTAAPARTKSSNSSTTNRRSSGRPQGR
jgi:hypothetical protein